MVGHGRKACQTKQVGASRGIYGVNSQEEINSKLKSADEDINDEGMEKAPDSEENDQEDITNFENIETLHNCS